MKNSIDKYHGFEMLVLEHHVRVRAFIRSLGVDPDWVDDIAQEAFMTAYRRWDLFDTSRDFGRWVRGIAANIVRNEIRKQARRQRILHSGLTDVLLSLHGQSEERVEPLAIDAIRACLSELNPSSLRIIQGRYRDGLSAPELARRHGKSAANIRQRLLRIRRQIRACVELRVATES